MAKAVTNNAGLDQAAEAYRGICPFPGALVPEGFIWCHCCCTSFRNTKAVSGCGFCGCQCWDSANQHFCLCQEYESSRRCHLPVWECGNEGKTAVYWCRHDPEDPNQKTMCCVHSSESRGTCFCCNSGSRYDCRCPPLPLMTNFNIGFCRICKCCSVELGCFCDHRCALPTHEAQRCARVACCNVYLIGERGEDFPNPALEIYERQKENIIKIEPRATKLSLSS